MKKKDIIRKLINRIGDDNQVASSRVSIIGQPSRQWMIFNLLLYLCDVNEFVAMIKHPIGSVRVYGYLGLEYNGYPDLELLKNRLLLDRSIVNTFEGCLLQVDLVANCTKETHRWYDKESSLSFLKKISKNDLLRERLIRDLLSDKAFHSISLIED